MSLVGVLALPSLRDSWDCFRYFVLKSSADIVVEQRVESAGLAHVSQQIVSKVLRARAGNGVHSTNHISSFAADGRAVCDKYIYFVVGRT